MSQRWEGLKNVNIPTLITRCLCSYSLSVSPSGKVLFRRSHIRDVAVRRLKHLDNYCKVRLNGLGILINVIFFIMIPVKMHACSG